MGSNPATPTIFCHDTLIFLSVSFSWPKLVPDWCPKKTRICANVSERVGPAPEHPPLDLGGPVKRTSGLPRSKGIIGFSSAHQGGHRTGRADSSVDGFRRAPPASDSPMSTDDDFPANGKRTTSVTSQGRRGGQRATADDRLGHQRPRRADEQRPRRLSAKNGVAPFALQLFPNRFVRMAADQEMS